MPTEFSRIRLRVPLAAAWGIQIFTRVALLATCSILFALAPSPWQGHCQAAEPERISSSAPKTASIKYVSVERAEIYAGPSEQYYPTSYVKKGEAVEVYQRTNDGWLGIRPPRGSFSWLPAGQGYLLPGGRTVEVTDEGAVSWIGSELGTAKQYRWQVQLHPGEQLTILGEAKTVGDDDREALWYRIAPPAGEFRWIRARATSDTSPSTSDKKSVPAKAPADEQRTNEPVQPNSTVAQEYNQGRSAAETKQATVAAANVAAANFEQEPDTNESPATGRREPKPLGTRRANAARTTAQPDPWAGWHALEYTPQGWIFPALDRMLGRTPATADRIPSSANAQAHRYDPFDLTQQSTLTGSRGLDTNTNMSNPPETTWRNPELLRQRRLAKLDRDVSREESGFSETDRIRTLDSEAGVKLVGSNANRFSESENVEFAFSNSRNVLSSSAALSDPSYHSIENMPSTWHGYSPPRAASEYNPLAFSNLDLSQVHIALSEIVSQPLNNWNLVPLADRVKHLVEHGTSAIERGEARLLLERIQSFQDLARKSAGMFGAIDLQSRNASYTGIQADGSLVQPAAAWQTSGQTFSSGPLNGGLSTASGSSALPRLATQPYDASGWLVPVHTSNPNQPQYALTDAAGKTITYLSAAPGLNLDRFVDQAVGVYGLRGYLPQLKANHIETQRVVRLR